MSEDDIETIRRQLAYQPLFGGGLRGVGYFDVPRLGITEAIDLLEWFATRYADDTKRAFGSPTGG